MESTEVKCREQDARGRNPLKIERVHPTNAIIHKPVPRGVPNQQQIHAATRHLLQPLQSEPGRALIKSQDGVHLGVIPKQRFHNVTHGECHYLLSFCEEL
jgi:hypothetical protein